MKALPFYTLCALFLCGFSACSPKLTPFTQRLYEENNWTQEDLARIQFYLSENIVLRRQASSGSSRIESGEIKVVNGQKVEEIVIPRGTPGVFLFSPKEDRFAISFESKGEDRYLMFGPNPKQGNRYVLLASEWNRNQGTVTYDGKSYQVAASDAMATLLVNLKKTRRVTVNSRTASGRKIN